jgi:hypothetical protein
VLERGVRCASDIEYLVYQVNSMGRFERHFVALPSIIVSSECCIIDCNGYLTCVENSDVVSVRSNALRTPFLSKVGELLQVALIESLERSIDTYHPRGGPLRKELDCNADLRSVKETQKTTSHR